MRSIYFEIYEDLRDRIEAGEFVYGGFIPSEAVLVEDYECSHNTLRKSLSVLRLHGYVTDPSPASPASMWTDSAVRRYVREAGPLYSRLNALTRADVTTRRKAREQEHMRRVDAIEDRVAATTGTCPESGKNSALRTQQS